MLQHLVILLNDMSTSYCHYRLPKDRENRWIGVDNLERGIRFAMMENMMIHVVYPEMGLPKGYEEVINSIDYVKIKPFVENKKQEADVLVFNELPLNLPEDKYSNILFRLTLQEFYSFPYYLAEQLFQFVIRFNIVIRDIDPIQAWDLDRYREKLEEMSGWLEKEYLKGNMPQWNILTDRLMLSKMNNCGAGEITITLAPNGRFYICPAFYYEDINDDVGDLRTGINIPNQQLYKLEYAPICRHCDAYQCRRCIWFNRKKTLEVNTPGHEQCEVAHVERNTSRKLWLNLRKHGNFFPELEIKEIDYLDPFNNREQWKTENL